MYKHHQQKTFFTHLKETLLQQNTHPIANPLHLPFWPPPSRSAKQLPRAAQPKRRKAKRKSGERGEALVAFIKSLAPETVIMAGVRDEAQSILAVREEERTGARWGGGFCFHFLGGNHFFPKSLGIQDSDVSLDSIGLYSSEEFWGGVLVYVLDALVYGSWFGLGFIMSSACPLPVV